MSAVDTTVTTPFVPRWALPHEVQLRSCMLLVESGPDAGKRFGPLGDQTTIGREVWCDIGLTDPLVSKQHCELAWTSTGLRLRDLGSTNGVVCGGMRVYDVVLCPDARFRIGSTTLRVELQDGTQTCLSCALDPTCSLVGASAQMRRLFGTMQRVGPRDIPVLLLGETGTGKTAIAQAMHKLSGRKDRPFVSINCAAVPAELIESTLFGHVRGAFTGAHRTVAGLFEQADGGTVLLDEIGEMPLPLQAKLLSVLEARSVRPVGSQCEVTVDFRLLCATNRDLAHEVSCGRFRQDLYFRVAVMELTVPALRERLSDLGMLADWLTMRVAGRLRESGAECPVTGISAEAVHVLEQHTWPGNVRELENVLARAVALAESHIIEPDDILLRPWTAVYDGLTSLPACTNTDPQVPLSDAPSRGKTSGSPLSFREFKAALLQTHERAYFQQLLAHTSGNVTRAAEVSGLSRTYMKAMIKKYGNGAEGEAMRG